MDMSGWFRWKERLARSSSSMAKCCTIHIQLTMHAYGTILHGDLQRCIGPQPCTLHAGVIGLNGPGRCQCMARTPRDCMNSNASIRGCCRRCLNEHHYSSSTNAKDFFVATISKELNINQKNCVDAAPTTPNARCTAAVSMQRRWRCSRNTRHCTRPHDLFRA